jgi:hypothetical protein
MSSSRIILQLLIGLSFFYCGAQTGDLSNNRKGVVIDPAVRKKAEKALNIKGVSAILNVTFYDDGVKKEMLLFSGDKLPHQSYAAIRKDSITIFITNILSSTFGYRIVKSKDTCVVFHYAATRDATTSYRRCSDGAEYKPGFDVPCAFYLVLDKIEYKKGEPIYGYIEGHSDKFCEINPGKKDVEKRTEFNGYFKVEPDHKDSN